MIARGPGGEAGRRFGRSPPRAQGPGCGPWALPTALERAPKDCGKSLGAQRRAAAHRRYHAAPLDRAGRPGRIGTIPHNTEAFHDSKLHGGEVGPMLTLRGRYRHGVVVMLEEVPLEGEHEVLVTFLDAHDLVVVPQGVHDVAARIASMAACSISQREYDVLRMLHSGATNREIATQLGIRPGTVRNHTSSIYEKLGVRNRLEAVARGVELGVLGKAS